MSIFQPWLYILLQHGQRDWCNLSFRQQTDTDMTEYVNQDERDQVGQLGTVFTPQGCLPHPATPGVGPFVLADQCRPGQRQFIVL